MLIFSNKQEVEASLATTAWLDKKIGLSSDLETNAYLNNLTKKLVTALHRTALGHEQKPKVLKKYRSYPWQVFLLESDNLNAFSSGAGAIYVTRGLLKKLQTEAELASIISHEMAHQILGHS